MTSEESRTRTASRKPRGRPFAKGNGGRKPGSRNKSTLLAEALLRSEEVQLVRKAIELAKNGDAQMLKFCLERILPRDRSVRVDLPPIDNLHDAFEAYSAIVRAVAAGEIAPSEGTAVAALVASFARFVDIADFEKRIQALESEIHELRPKP